MPSISGMDETDKRHHLHACRCMLMQLGYHTNRFGRLLPRDESMLSGMCDEYGDSRSHLSTLPLDVIRILPAYIVCRQGCLVYDDYMIWLSYMGYGAVHGGTVIEIQPSPHRVYIYNEFSRYPRVAIDPHRRYVSIIYADDDGGVAVIDDGVLQDELAYNRLVGLFGQIYIDAVRTYTSLVFSI